MKRTVWLLLLDLTAEHCCQSSFKELQGSKQNYQVVSFVILSIWAHYSGGTALIVAVKNSQRLIIELLVYNGAYINAKDRKGKTALDYIKSNGHSDIFDLLISKRDKGFWQYFLSGFEMVFDSVNRIIPERFLRIFWANMNFCKISAWNG